MKAFDSARWLRASSHLDRVLELPPGERDACIVALRAEEPEIATDVQAMLDQHRQLSEAGFLDSAPPIKPIEPSLAGVTIGSYTLMAPLGHGGMGSVWVASRSDGRYEGRVAVKLLHAALVGRGGEERFRREGTILARLAHPHIARLIDAGVSNTGTPYLVLELVEGKHIDVYCDDARLGLEERIRLFLDVQSAVAHAHANLIVHRDLKPSNVLVTTEGEVKLLDFSIAKLIEDEGMSRLTREAGPALTPKYAAPEQVTNGQITTATDVYALGVLLYELLSGFHPLGNSPKVPADFTKALVEKEPIRLGSSMQAEKSSEALERLASLRTTTTDRLVRQLRGDLDTILGKALKKNPAERYASVAEFADDLRRYVEHQPISARPDTLSYRGAKFVRRHWRVVGAVAAAVVAIATVIGFYTVQLAQERDEAQLQAEKASRVSELLTSILTGADPFRQPGAGEPTVRGLLDAGTRRIETDLADQPELQAEMFTVIGRTYDHLGLNDKALPLLERAVALGRSRYGEDARVALSLNNLGVLQRRMGHMDASEPALRESLAIRRRLLGNDTNEVAITLVELARTLQGRGKDDEAEPMVREALAIRQRIYGEEHHETATSKSELGQLLWEKGDLAGGEKLLRENVATTERLSGVNHPNAGASKGQLAGLLLAKGDVAGAELLYRESVRVRREAFGETHQDYALTLTGPASVLEAQGRLEEAQALLEEAMRIATARLGPDNPRVLGPTMDLARVQLARGQGAGTEATLRHVLVLRQQMLTADDWRIGQTQSLLAASLLAQKRDAEAEPLMLAADNALKPVPGRQQNERVANRSRLAAMYERQGKPERAAAFR